LSSAAVIEESHQSDTLDGVVIVRSTLLVAGLALLSAGAFRAQGPNATDCGTPPADVTALARNVRDTLRREYSEPKRFTYLEKRRDIEISRLGKVYVGPLRTFEVYPGLVDDYKRLIEIDGKPLDPAELARRDAEHQQNLVRKAAREKSESPDRRAARLAKESEEIRERDAILDDAARVFAFDFVCRETFEGEPVTVVSMKPRRQAHVTTREGEWMKRSEGRLWVADKGHIARVRITAVDDLSIGWGVVARVESGSGFDYVRKRIGEAWLPSKLTMEGSGRTLLFRRFEVKTVTTYTNHQPLAPTPGS
jgi:hypothetical protein